MVNNWGGGTTTELFIYPTNSIYSKRDFGFRLSIATIEESPSVFTKLENIERTTLILSGSIEISIDGNVSNLEELDQISYNGGQETISTGYCRDFNLMCRDGYSGSLNVIDRENINVEQSSPNHIKVIYLDQGEFTIGPAKVQAGDLVILENGQITLNEGCLAIVAEIKKPQ